MVFFLKKVVVIFLIILTSCEENQLTSLDKDVTPESRWFEVIQLINNKEYERAIELLADVPDDIKLKRENLVRYSSAYAGFCGLDLLELVNSADGLNGRTPLSFFMSIFTDPTPEKLVACQTAISIIEDNISLNAEDRNAEENIASMAYLMAGIGLFLNSKFDIDGDGNIDAGTNTCGTLQLSDAEAKQLGAAITKMFEASLYIIDVDILKEIQDEVTTGCDELESISSVLNFCSKIDPTSYSPSETRGVRSIVQEGQVFGIGSCSSSPNSLANCVCL